MEEAGTLKKRYRIIILVASILLLAAIVVLIIGFFITPAKYEQYFDEGYTACIAENEQAYYMVLMQKTGDRSYCNKLSPQMAQQCVQQAKPIDLGVCEGLQEQENKLCKAQLTKDPTLCTENDSWCLATASFNPVYCEQIRDEATKNECIAIATLNPDYYVSDEVKQSCARSAKLYAESKITAE